jgi:ADP-ribose pyrophosphatase YjhB (NUDIX family)
MKDNWIPEKLYREIQRSIPILCVDVVVECGGGVLLMKRKNYPAKNKFWIPGGRLKLGEGLKKFAVEKVKEETGLDVRIKKFIGVYSLIFKKGFFGFPVHDITICFLAKKIGGKLKIDEDHSKAIIVKKLPKSLDWYPRKVIHDSKILK